jgi:hypothetical protein
MKRMPRTIIAYLISLVIMIAVFVLKFRTLPPQIPLFYSLPDSDNQIVDTWYIFILPILSFVCINVNNYIYRRWFRHDYFIRICVYASNLTIIFFFTYIFVKILILVS